MATTKPRRKKRATSRRDTVSGRHYRGMSKEQKRRWKEDPEFRAFHTARLRKLAQTRDPKGRLGVPDGMRKAKAMVLWAQAKDKAREFIQIMEDADKLPKVTIPGTEEDMAKRALEEAFVYAVGPLTDAKSKAAYLRLVLEYTKSKPESKSKLTLENSAEWLAALAADMKKDGSQPQ